ncbi:uncharacterized protein C8Q71DRAFT_723123 [Rhodofomes roseus]|uniref:Knr4/Smi1-like domain-containing protein n=1 Tax=Rhodofomes roseus TaxID=34475 RepID=A0ABQ8KK88_9APHY|nr:uncharacterized protein C8Q71DRAFT_723123 [Rhodofomes roseus]KAH9837849.1 hypothetical protein C8Q71DRAFT_723123 [Rhodofomes roseus]
MGYSLGCMSNGFLGLASILAVTLNDPTRRKMNAMVYIAGALNTNHLGFLDTLRIRERAIYLIADGDLEDEKARGIGDAQISQVSSFLEQGDRGRYDILFIPGPSDITAVSVEAAASHIQALYGNGLNTVATGSGRLLLASSGLLKERTASAASLDVPQTQVASAQEWLEDNIIRDGYFWTAEDSPETLRSLAYLVKAAVRGELQCAIFPLPTFRKHWKAQSGEQGATIHSEPTKPSTTPGADLAKSINSYSPAEADRIPHSVVHLAIRVGLEGSMSSCNALVRALFQMFPNAYGLLGASSTRPFEYLWRDAGNRLHVPWDAPSDEDLRSWEQEVKEMHHYPSDDDLMDVLEYVKVCVAYEPGDWRMPPYSHAGVVAIALGAGAEKEAREWMSELVRDATHSDATWTWDIGRWPILVEYAKQTGIVAEITRRSVEQAEEDAELARQALLSFPHTSIAVQNQRRAAMEKLRNAPMSSLVPMLEVLKWEEHETLLKPPASLSAIREAEERLGTELPDDLKEFYLVSNGVEFMPLANAPGFRPVEDLKWERAVDLGLDQIAVDLGCEIDGAEWDQLPKMDRILVISDSDSEENVWYVDSETVGKAISVIRSLRRSVDVSGEPGWRAVFWCYWMVETRWLERGFRGYIEELARESEKKSAVLNV